MRNITIAIALNKANENLSNILEAYLYCVSLLVFINTDIQRMRMTFYFCNMVLSINNNIFKQKISETVKGSTLQLSRYIHII